MTDDELDDLWIRHAGALMHVVAIGSQWVRLWMDTPIGEELSLETFRLGRELVQAIEKFEYDAERG